jgi:hypothetical protein
MGLNVLTSNIGILLRCKTPALALQAAKRAQLQSS